MKYKRLLVILGVVAALAMGLTLAVEAEVSKPAQCLDKELCAQKLLFGRESFDRGKFNQAKTYFREAVQADPSSVKAWAFYDLSMMYAVAEQIKNTGTVKTSSAPEPSASAPTTAPQPAAPPAAPPAAEAPKPPAPAPAPPPGIPVIKPDEGC